MKKYLENIFKDKKVLILGMGKEGQSTLDFLHKFLPNITVSTADQKDGDNYLQNLQNYDIIIKSPGISAFKEEIIAAKEKGIEITSQTKIFFDICQGIIIGITGTKGKSTTSSLIYSILKSAGYNVSLIGNIGNPVLDYLKDDSKDKYFVFELSSHQLFDLDKSPHVSVVTNVGVDHLDWYKTFEKYKDAKSNIVRFQKDDDIAILNYDNEFSRSFAELTKGKVFYTSKEKIVSGAYSENGKIYLNIDGKTEELGETKKLKLIGKHNWDNVMEAAVAAKSVGVETSVIKDAVYKFEQLEHHLEFVRNINGTDFYNDSFATDQIAAIAAINSFDRDLTLILGGYDRGIDYTEIGIQVSKKPNIKTVVVIGDTTKKIVDSLHLAKFKGQIIELGKVNINHIVYKAFVNTHKGGIVLFSPAAASFDMFKDYKDRGTQFKEAVSKL